MTIVDLKSYDDDSYCDLPLPSGWGHFVENLTDTMLGGGYPVSVWLPSLKKIFEGQFVFEYRSLEELYVLVQATLHSLANRKPV